MSRHKNKTFQAFSLSHTENSDWSVTVITEGSVAGSLQGGREPNASWIISSGYRSERHFRELNTATCWEESTGCVVTTGFCYVRIMLHSSHLQNRYREAVSQNAHMNTTLLCVFSFQTDVLFIFDCSGWEFCWASRPLSSFDRQMDETLPPDTFLTFTIEFLFVPFAVKRILIE